MKLSLLVLFVTFAAVAWADYTPQQVHIAVGTQPGDFTFTWSTRSQASAPLVLINNGPMANATAQEFSSGTNTWYIYKTAVSGLTPGNTYSYQIGDRALGLSSLYSFTVPPQDTPTNYIVIGDLSTSSQYGNPTWQAIGKFIETNPAQAFFHVGDIAYDLCTNDNTNGDTFMQEIQSTATSIPYMTMPGNHEYTDTFANYIARFNYAGDTQNFWYTFTSGYARFVVFTTEFWFSEYTHLLDPQLTWLTEVLTRTAEDVEQYPWLVVMTHRPLYCCQKGSKPDCNSDAETLQTALEKLIYDSDVDLYINGHVHNYQRTTPIHKGEAVASSSTSLFVNPGAPVYVTAGGSGCDEGNSNLDASPCGDWWATGTTDYSFGYLSVYNATHLGYKQYTVSPTSLFDQFLVVKTNART